MTDDVRIDAVTEADFPTVAHLGETIWRGHYSKIISMAQIEYMLAGRYVPDRLRTYLGASDRWLELLRLNSEPIGYCSYSLTATAGEMKLEQLYLRAEFKGRGFGGRMLRHVETQARDRGCVSLMLTVNKYNTDSIAIYRKSGFVVREEAVFDIGNGFVMDDYVMMKVLKVI